MDLNFKKVFIVAELSANHGNEIKIALETVRAAKRAGADAIKLQTYTPDTMTLDSKSDDFIVKGGSIWDGQTFYELYKKAYTPWEWHREIFDLAKEEGLVCFSTPFDKSSVDFLEELNNPIYKIASFEINDVPLLEYVAKTNKPIILSTGIATKDDIELALETIRAHSDNQIALLKCTSSYPAPIDKANLIMIKDFQKKYDVVTGLSDHTMGNISSIVATSLGGKIIEKHFILNKSIGGPDSSFSLDENEFKSMVNDIRDTEMSLGQINYNLTSNQKTARNYSRSLYIVENVKEGQYLTEDNIRCIRPGFGIEPKHLNSVLGKKFTKNYSKGTRLTFDKIKK